MRAINDGPDFRRIFCLVHAEKLSYQVCDNALRSLSEYSQGRSGMHACIIIYDSYIHVYQLICLSSLSVWLDNCMVMYRVISDTHLLHGVYLFI